MRWLLLIEWLGPPPNPTQVTPAYQFTPYTYFPCLFLGVMGDLAASGSDSAGALLEPSPIVGKYPEESSVSSSKLIICDWIISPTVNLVNNNIIVNTLI